MTCWWPDSPSSSGGIREKNVSLFQGLRLALSNRLNIEDSTLPPFCMKIRAGQACKIL